MKSLLIVLTTFLFVTPSYSQTFDEWFKQKKTQKKYLVEQIVALKVYLEYLKKGYDIAKKGMRIVGDIKEGNLNSHKEYFTSLKSVNTVINGSGKVSDIVAYQNLIRSNLQNLKIDCQSDENLLPDEKVYIAKVCDQMVKESDDLVDELQTLTTSGNLEMKDDERINRLDELYDDAKDKYAFTRSFANGCKMLIQQRSKESHDVESSFKLNNNL